MVWKILFLTFVLYCMYRVTVRILLPIWRTTRQIKKGFRAAQEEMQRRQEAASSQGSPAQKPPIQGDYIDFEEVK